MFVSIFRKLIDSMERTWKNGLEIDHYYVKQLIGKGSYGTAYLVNHQETGKPAVLKRIRPYKKLVGNPMNYLENEMNALNDLSHPQIPALYAKGEYRGTPYFIMEWKNGKNFEQLIFGEEQSYSELESLQITVKLMKLVQWIHRKGYIHRDLRIPNILFYENEISVVDFGLACLQEGTGNGKHKIHKDYMREKTVKSDFYAVGHFLLFLLYSSFEPSIKKEKSWEEELSLSSKTKHILRKLLQIENPYEDDNEVLNDLYAAIKLLK
jgi:serine/threonine protein kinase, bacterial